MKRILNVYIAGPWFTPKAEETLTRLENLAMESSIVKAYRPRHDGVKLKAGEIHDPELRKSVFNDNVHNIDKSDFVLANLDSRDGVMDTGTLWEVGYAVSKGIPVYVWDPAGKSNETLGSLYNSVRDVFDSYESIEYFLGSCIGEGLYPKPYTPVKSALLLTPRGKSDDYRGVATKIIDSGMKLKWADSYDHPRFKEELETMLEDVGVIVAVIDDKDPVVSYMIGYAYKKLIPVVTYTNYDYDVNIMLLCSILRHVKGVKELGDILDVLASEGFDGIPEFDHSTIKAQ